MSFYPCSLQTLMVDSSVTLSVDTDGLFWSSILSYIPFSDKIFIAGSAATWLAERAIFGCDPDWSPGDIDVFICQNDFLFGSIVNALIKRHFCTDSVKVVRRRGIVDVKVMHETNLSFIRCDASLNALAVVEQFDIDICRPIVMCNDGKFTVTMTADVAANIKNRLMRGDIKQSRKFCMHYPLSRSLHRLSKYETRGYSLLLLTFHSVMHVDFPDQECVLQSADFLPLCEKCNAL